MAKKESTPKMEYEREYIVPLRQGWLKVPAYKRANKAVKTLKEFIARHMEVYDRDLRKVKVGVDLNNELRFRGMTKPPAKVRVRAKKFDDGTVNVELVELPKHLEFRDKKVEKRDKGEKKVAPVVKAVEESEGNEETNSEKSIEGTKGESGDDGPKEVADEKKVEDKKEVKKEEKTKK